MQDAPTTATLIRPLRDLPLRDHDTQLRQRLLGLCVMILLAVVILPWLLHAQPRRTVPDWRTSVPSESDGATGAAMLTPAAAATGPTQSGALQPHPVPAPKVNTLPPAFTQETTMLAVAKPAGDNTPTPTDTEPTNATPAPSTAAKTTKPLADWAILQAHYRSEEATLAPKNRIAALRLPVMVLPFGEGANKVWNVWIGPFKDEKAARAAQAVLKRQQISHEKPRLLKRKR